MDVLKTVLAARQDKSPQVGVVDALCMQQNTCFSAERAVTPAVQVQALLDCVTDAAFNLQVCICSVGMFEPPFRGTEDI
jgi:hypothetical protein